MMRDPKVFIIILNWNGLSDTVQCLESIQRLNYENYEVIVVDNGSSDNPGAYLKSNFPWIVLIENANNFGFTGGNNIAMRYAAAKNADYMWLVNNDTVLHVDSLRNLVSMAETSPAIGLASPLVFHFDYPDKRQFAGSYLDWKTFSLMYPVDNNEVGEEFQTGKDVCLWGTALLIKRTLIERIGYLKDEYFAYWEDTEYSIRAIKAGFKNVVCKSAKVLHKIQRDEANRIKRGKHFYYFMERNKIFLENEYLGKSISRLAFKIRCIARVSDYVRRCGEENIDACMDGAWHGIKGINGPMSNGSRMPNYLKGFLLFMSRYHPVFFADLITLNLENIFQKVLTRL